MTTPVHLSIIIPAFNEETRLLPTLEAIEAYRISRPFVSEVLVVDDCSIDNTSGVVTRFAEKHDGYRVFRQPFNQGKGAAVRAGMLATTGAYRLFTDADNSTPIEQADSFFPFFDGSADGTKYDVVIGSRRVKGARLARRQPPHRELSGRIYSLLVRALVIPGFLDTQCGFKMFSARAADGIFPLQTIPGFGFDIEVIIIAIKRLGYRVKEAPVLWIDSSPSQVRLLRDSVGMFRELLKLCWGGSASKTR